jgi:hypothetical protein
LVIIKVKVLFTDIDGVLNCSETISLPDQIDPAKVALLNWVCRETGCKIVISSTWRIIHPLLELTSILRSNGFEGEIIGATPSFKRSMARGQEIEWWLKNHPEVIQWAVVDDDTADMKEVIHRQAVTSFHDGGLKPVHAKQLIELLK